MTESNVSESNLVNHARTELTLAGLMDKDSDYGGMLGDAALELVKVFDKQGHSGHSAIVTIKLITELLQYKNLTPLTDNPDEWAEVGDDLWQNIRNSTCFSKDGGKTYTMLEDKAKGTIYTAEEAKQ